MHKYWNTFWATVAGCGKLTSQYARCCRWPQISKHQIKINKVVYFLCWVNIRHTLDAESVAIHSISEKKVQYGSGLYRVQRIGRTTFSKQFKYFDEWNMSFVNLRGVWTSFGHGKVKPISVNPIGCGARPPALRETFFVRSVYESLTWPPKRLRNTEQLSVSPFIFKDNYTASEPEFWWISSQRIGC